MGLIRMIKVIMLVIKLIEKCQCDNLSEIFYIDYHPPR